MRHRASAEHVNERLVGMADAMIAALDEAAAIAAAEYDRRPPVPPARTMAGAAPGASGVTLSARPPAPPSGAEGGPAQP